MKVEGAKGTVIEEQERAYKKLKSRTFWLTLVWILAAVVLTIFGHSYAGTAWWIAGVTTTVYIGGEKMLDATWMKVYGK